MRKAFRKNWTPKIVALVLATAIWLLIRQHLEDQGEWIKAPSEEAVPPKARIVTPEELRQQQEEQLAAAISLMVKQYLREQEQLNEPPPETPAESPEEPSGTEQENP